MLTAHCVYFPCYGNTEELPNVALAPSLGASVRKEQEDTAATFDELSKVFIDVLTLFSCAHNHLKFTLLYSVAMFRMLRQITATTKFLYVFLCLNSWATLSDTWDVVAVLGLCFFFQQDKQQDKRWKFFFMMNMKRTWWEGHYLPDKRYLLKGWGNDLKDKFHASLPDKCHCAVRLLQNRVVHEMSRKANCSNALPANRECIGGSCSRMYEFRICDFPKTKKINVEVWRKFYTLLRCCLKCDWKHSQASIIWTFCIAIAV